MKRDQTRSGNFGGISAALEVKLENFFVQTSPTPRRLEQKAQTQRTEKFSLEV
jgi:hypothetical protein